MQGINIDYQPLNQPDNTYRMALNAIHDNKFGERGARTNEQSNEFCAEFPNKILGTITLNKDEFVVFNENALFLFNAATCEKQLIIECSNLNIVSDVTGVYRLKESCNEREIFWIDGKNPVRTLNIDNHKNDCGVDLFKCQQVGELSVNVLNIGGFLSVGAYQFAYRKKNGGVHVISDIVYITDDSVSNTWENIDGAPTGTTTNKAIEVQINYLNAADELVEIIVFKRIGGVVSVEVVAAIGGTDNPKVIYTGIGLPTTLHDVFNASVSYKTATIITQYQDQLLLGGVSQKKNIDYQQKANQIKVNWVSYKIPAKYAYKFPEFQKFKTFMGDEVYALGIVGKYCDGTYTPVFHIPGRQKAPGDAVLVAAVNPDNFYHCDKETWEVYNTATITEKPHLETKIIENCGVYEIDLHVWERGEMAYNEQCIVYPNTENCNHERMFEQGNVRHHRMPDRTLVPHFDSVLDPDVECFEFVDDNAFMSTTRPYKGSLNSLGEYEDNFIYPIGIEVTNIEPMISDFPIISYEIVFVERNEHNKTVIAKGITHKCFATTTTSGNIAAHPHYNVNATMNNVFSLSSFNGSISAYSNVSVPNVIETEKLPIYKFHSPNTSYNKPFLGASYFTVEQQWNGNGRYYGADDYNNLEERIKCVRFNFDMRNYNNTLDLQRPQITQKNRHVLNSSYIEANSINTAFQVPFLNLHQESGIAFSLDYVLRFQAPCMTCLEGFSGLCYNDLRDNSLIHTAPNCSGRINCAQALYGGLKRILCNQYGDLTSLEYKALNIPTRTITPEGSTYKMELLNIFGDAFINFWSYRRTALLHKNNQDFTFFLQDENTPTATLINSFYESDINVDLQHEGEVSLGETYYPKLGSGTYLLDTPGENLTSEKSFLSQFHFNYEQDAFVNTGIDNSFNYNQDFSSNKFSKSFFSFPVNYNVCDCSDETKNEVAVSLKSDWKVFKPTNNLKIPTTYGALTNVFSLNNNLYAHTEENLWKIFTSESKITTTGSEVLLGHGSLFSATPHYLFATEQGVAGLQKKYGTFINQYGYHFFDNKAGILYRFTDSIVPLTQGLSQFFKSNRDSVRFVFGFDYVFDRLLFCAKHENSCKDYTLSYTEEEKSWTSFHSYLPDYFLQTRSSLFSLVENKIWKHHKENDYQTYYNNYYPFIIEVVEKSDAQKLWEYATYIQKAEKFDLTLNRLVPKNDTFTQAIFYNSRQNSGLLDLINHTEQNQNYMQNASRNVSGEAKVNSKEHYWTLNEFSDFVKDASLASYYYDCLFPRDLKTTNIDFNKPHYEISRFRDLYLIQRFFFNRPDDTTLKLTHSLLHNIKSHSIR